MEKFLLNIKKRPALWDKRRSDHYNKAYVKLLWSAVEKESNFEPGTATKKFKSLKDTFRKEYRKSPQQSKWIYFRHLLFLKDILGSHVTQNSVDQNEHVDVDTEEDTIIEIVHNNEQSAFSNKRGRNNDSPPTSSKRLKTLPSSESGDKFRSTNAGLNNKHLGDANNDDGDDDFHFLMSCRKYLKQMPPQKKLQFRIKLQELMYKFVYSDESCTKASNRTSSTNVFSENQPKHQEEFISVTAESEFLDEFTECEDIKPDISEIQIF